MTCKKEFYFHVFNGAHTLIPWRLKKKKNNFPLNLKLKSENSSCRYHVYIGLSWNLCDRKTNEKIKCEL